MLIRFYGLTLLPACDFVFHETRKSRSNIMPVPQFEEFQLPALKECADGQVHRPGEMAEKMAARFRLSESEIAETLPSGGQTKLENRVNWALYDLFRAGLLNRPVRGRYSISDEGRRVLVNPPARIDREFLSSYPAFKNWATAPERQPNSGPLRPLTSTDPQTTPDEQIENAAQELNATLAIELARQVAKMNPFRFEQLVVDLLFAMGYGGSREEAAKVTKKSGDEGIDGVINEDRLGLDVIYLQAKRWQAQVGRPEVQGFVGALAGKQAHKGVFITTSTFSANAVEYARSVPQKVILIDGERLGILMIEHNVGVSVARTVAIKRVDSDYFEES
jgi:restriction system protein